MCTSRKESGPPMVAILQGLSANVQYATLNQYSLLPPQQTTYLDIRTEKHKSKEDKVSIKAQFQLKPMKYSTNQLAAQSTKSFVDELM